MIRGLLIYVATMITALVATTLVTGVPLVTSAGVVLLCEITIIGTLLGAAVLRRMNRPKRQEWTYTRRHSPLAGAPRVSHPAIVAGDAPPERVIYVLPPAQIEAPKREVEVYHDV